MTKQKFNIIYSKIKSDIIDGLYENGSQLPSEHELMKINNASRETIRKALNLLASDGMIQKIRGKGSVVINQNKTEFPFSELISFKEVKQKLNLAHQTKLLVNEKILASDVPMIKEKLDVRNTDTLLHIVRTRNVDDQVKIIDEDYFLTSVVPHIPDSVAEDSIYNYLEHHLGIDISYSNKAITFEPFSQRDYKLFGKVNPPYTATVRSVIYSKDTSTIQYNISKHLATEFTFKEFSRRTF